MPLSAHEPSRFCGIWCEAEAVSQRVSRPSGIKFTKIEKRYGSVYALRRLDMEIAAGECVALAGRNGSGKTTLLRVASQLTSPTRGEVSFPDLKADEVPAIGYVSHAVMIYEDMTAQENLMLFARLLGIPNPAKRAAELLAATS